MNQRVREGVSAHFGFVQDGVRRGDAGIVRRVVDGCGDGWNQERRSLPRRLPPYRGNRGLDADLSQSQPRMRARKSPLANGLVP
jgi:hypothetical protein